MISPHLAPTRAYVALGGPQAIRSGDIKNAFARDDEWKKHNQFLYAASKQDKIMHGLEPPDHPTIAAPQIPKMDKWNNEVCHN